MVRREKREKINRDMLERVMKDRGIKGTELCKELEIEYHHWQRNKREEKFTMTDINNMARVLDCEPSWIRGVDLSGRRKHEDGETMENRLGGWYHERNTAPVDRWNEACDLVVKALELIEEDVRIADGVTLKEHLKTVNRLGLTPALPVIMAFEGMVEEIKKASAIQHDTIEKLQNRRKKK